MSTKCLVEFGILKLGGGMMISINTSKKNEDYWTWKIGASKEDYLAAKKCAKHAIYNAKYAAQETWFSEINTEMDCNKIFKLAKKMKVENTWCSWEQIKVKVKDKGYNLILGDKEKLHVWKSHHDEQLLNVEFNF